MRVPVAAALMLTFPLIATAQPRGSGEVKTVTAARFQIVGFTVATYNENLGGPFGTTRKCQLEFPESRMCSSLEVRETTTIPGGLSGLAWVDFGCPSVDGNAPVVDGETGGSRIWNCMFPLPIACCAPVP